MAAVAAAVAVAGAPQAAAQADPLVALVDAAAQRLQTADPIAANKWITKGTIEDAARAGQVLDAVGADAAARGIDQERVRRIFTDQIGATEGIEYARFSQWKLDPAAAPTVAPELASSRTVIDGLNRTIVEQLAVNWPLLRSPDCAARVGEAIITVNAARALDPLYRQALSFVTRNYCGA